MRGRHDLNPRTFGAVAAAVLILVWAAAGCRSMDRSPDLPQVVSGDARANGAVLTADNGCVAEFLFLNECGGREENLIAWNEGEDFPSLGIGHLIWYPRGRTGPFKQMFPELIAYLEGRGLPAPAWIRSLPEGAAPWKSRAELIKDRDSVRTKELRAYLIDTRRAQADFIVERVKGLLPRLVQNASPNRRAAVRESFDRLSATERGRIALIDYVNFKGEGLFETERYRGQGWGLLQVLESMDLRGIRSDSPLAAVERFAAAADEVLTRRVRNSPPERGELRWLEGWRNRIRRYAAWECSTAD